MHVTIGAVGTLKKGPEADLVSEYCKRFDGVGRQLGFKGLRVQEVEASKSLPRGQRMEKEAELLLGPIAPQASIFVMDERGKAMTSKQLAASLADLRDEGTTESWFLIGGADGHGPQVKELIANNKARAISFGINTWPHMLLRAMLCEQLYRAVTILGNHPYHRE